MTHNAPYLIQFYLLREPALGRKHRRVTGKIAEDKRSRQNAHREREPWLLASNLPAEQWTAAKVVAVYKRRMQIEESFQDGCISRPRIWRGYEGKPQQQTTILMLLSGCSWPRLCKNSRSFLRTRCYANFGEVFASSLRGIYERSSDLIID